MSQSLTLTPDVPGAVAAAPLNLDLSLENKSTPLDHGHWFKEALIDIGGASASESLTPSRQLPNQLLIVGGGTCAPPSYSDCAAGNGVLDVRINTIFGALESTGAFGISKISNINIPSNDAYVSYRMIIRYCLYEGGTCVQRSDRVQEVTVQDGSEQLKFSMVGAETGVNGGILAEYAPRTFNLHLAGKSNKLESGEVTSQIYTVVTLPKSCGTFEGGSTYYSLAEGSVSIPQSLVVDGCPVAHLSPYQQNGFEAIFDGSGSSASVGGRSIARWHWDFGDGRGSSTTSSSVVHEYEPGSEHTVSLYVEDSAGARSAAVTRSVVTPPGKTLAISVAGSGAVTANGASCSSACTRVFPDGASVTLIANPAPGSSFQGWEGDCSGAASCQLAMNVDQSVSATFQPIEESGPPLIEESDAPQPVRSDAPPSTLGTKIHRVRVKGRGATIRFSGEGGATSFECALLRLGAGRKPRFRACRSPKRYTHLATGRYSFEVRAVGSTGLDETPARKRFVIE